jgi:hypothetical protein
MNDQLRNSFGWAFWALILIIMMEIWAKMKHPVIPVSPVLVVEEIAALVLFFLVWRGIWPKH